METIIAKVVNVGQLETYEYSNSPILAPDTIDAIPIYK